MTFFDNFNSFQLIAAHRGARAHYPENTYLAFISSIGKSHFIELDIQLSKDRVPMIIHDPTLQRTTNAKIKKDLFALASLEVKDWNCLQLKSLDVGSWFLDTDPFATILNNEVSAQDLLDKMPQTIMTLEEFLNHPELSKIPVNIEIKDHSLNEFDRQVTKAVIEVIKKTNSSKRVLISSFNHDYLLVAKTCLPTVSTAALQSGFHPPNLLEYLHALNVAAYHPANSITDAELVRTVRSAGFGLNVYTVNSEQRQAELFEMGVTAVFTDFPTLS